MATDHDWFDGLVTGQFTDKPTRKQSSCGLVNLLKSHI